MNSELHHLAAAYALDALDPDERAAFESHYPTCEICTADVLDYRETASVLAGAQAVDPPRSLEDRVMAEVSRTRQISPRLPDKVVDLATQRRGRNRRAAAAIAVAAALVAVVGFATSLRGSVTEIEAVLAAPDAVVTSLVGDDGVIQVVWSAERDQVAVLGNDLDSAGAGFVYELWFLVDEGVAPAGLFQPDNNGVIRITLDVDDVAGSGFGVTIEPEGGSDQPTGEVIYSGII